MDILKPLDFRKKPVRKSEGKPTMLLLSTTKIDDTTT
jgi:hypothetical protein